MELDELPGPAHRERSGTANGLFLRRFHHDVMGESCTGSLATFANRNDFLFLTGFFSFQ